MPQTKLVTSSLAGVHNSLVMLPSLEGNMTVQDMYMEHDGGTCGNNMSCSLRRHTVVELFEFERTYFPGDFVLDWPD